MEKQVLYSKLKKIFRGLGFLIKGNVYYIDFPEMTIKIYPVCQFGNVRLEYNISLHEIHGKFELNSEELKNNAIWDFNIIPRLNSEALFDYKVSSNLLDLNELELETKVISMLETYVYPLKGDYVSFFNKGITYNNITNNPCIGLLTWVENYTFMPDAEKYLFCKGLIIN